MQINKIQKPFWLTRQYPLDIRLWVPKEEDLFDFGQNNQKAFTYYSGMIVVAGDTGKMYIWKEFDPERESGLLPNGFRYPSNAKFGGIDYSNKLYNFVEFPFGIEMRFVGKATMWNDQITNSIVGNGTTQYVLSQQTFEQVIPYAIYDDKIWIKANIKSGDTITIKFYPDDSYSSDNNSVFYLYDEFDINNDEWNYRNSTIVDGKLKINGGNQIEGAYSIKPILDNSIIEWSMFSNSGDFDSGIKVGNLYFISDNGNGFHAIYNRWGYPSGSQQANTWNKYKVILKSENVKFTNISTGKNVTSNRVYIEGNLTFICDSDNVLNPLLVDYICVRKYYNEEYIDITVTQDEYGNYIATITNNGSDIIETEIALNDIPVGNYKVTALLTTPELSCNAFPDGIVSDVKFYTQFDHMTQLMSKADFHIHCYIPPDAPEGNVKLRLTWQTIPIDIVIGDDERHDFSFVNKSVNSVDKIFSITEDMRGKHVVFDFGPIDTVYSLSQVVFHKLERLGDDIDDTFASDIPFIYLDWHTIVNSLGSQDEFIKY